MAVLLGGKVFYLLELIFEKKTSRRKIAACGNKGYNSANNYKWSSEVHRILRLRKGGRFVAVNNVVFIEVSNGKLFRGRDGG